MNSEKGFTLVEVLIAITLVFLIGAAIVNIDFASRIGFIQAGNKSKVINEARFAMKHITRNLRLANQVSINSLPSGIITMTLRLDYDLSTNTPLNTPSDFTDDYECQYRYQPAQRKITYAHKSLAGGGGWGVFEDITNPSIAGGAGGDVTACSFNFLGGPASVPAVTITIKVRAKAGLPVSPSNPEVNLQTKVILRCRGRS
ncbi:MAG: prepilin-type N-terminal cleavage/methylation domain-containing protein [Candidatus Omnitrophota bacterium]|nr:prepilin-type N-terminal cleavage/methylation domain-containing protein [Candidatus Omnitrophota bacterium]